MGVVKARVQMDILVPEGEAATLGKSSLERIMSRIEHGPWLSCPVTVSAPLPLSASALKAELAAMEAAGCTFDEEDIAALGKPGGWWEGVRGLDDMVRMRDTFLADPGCHFDMFGIIEQADPQSVIFVRDGEQAVLQEHFKNLVNEFLFKPAFTVHRHVPVADVEEFVEGVRGADSPELLEMLIDAKEEDAEAAGSHWSLDRDTECPDFQDMGDDVVLTGEVDAASVDWFSTFQAAFSRPGGRELVLLQAPRPTSVTDKQTGATYDVGGPAAPAPGR